MYIIIFVIIRLCGYSTWSIVDVNGTSLPRSHNNMYLLITYSNGEDNTWS